MKNTVIIKGNRYGICIVLDEQIAFSQLLKDLEKRLSDAEKFFDSDQQLAVTFEGRELTNEELDQVLDVIRKCSKLNIQYVMDEDSELETTFFDIIQAAKEEEVLERQQEEERKKKEQEAAELLAKKEIKQAEFEKDASGMFYKGTLRSGQALESKTSIVIIGDVNPGASVTAGGNIVVIGDLKGSVTAGAYGNKDAFVMALQMNPIQIQIADVIARSSDKKKQKKVKQDAMIATLINGHILIEDVSRTVIQDLTRKE